MRDSYTGLTRASTHKESFLLGTKNRRTRVKPRLDDSFFDVRGVYGVDRALHGLHFAGSVLGLRVPMKLFAARERHGYFGRMPGLIGDRNHDVHLLPALDDVAYRGQISVCTCDKHPSSELLLLKSLNRSVSHPGVVRDDGLNVVLVFRER